MLAATLAQPVTHGQSCLPSADNDNVVPLTHGFLKLP
jgi:hypothetical protein